MGKKRRKRKKENFDEGVLREAKMISDFLRELSEGEINIYVDRVYISKFIAPTEKEEKIIRLKTDQISPEMGVLLETRGKLNDNYVRGKLKIVIEGANIKEIHLSPPDDVGIRPGDIRNQTALTEKKMIKRAFTFFDLILFALKRVLTKLLAKSS